MFYYCHTLLVLCRLQGAPRNTQKWFCGSGFVRLPSVARHSWSARTVIPDTLLQRFLP